jgi:D-psicose/D-tagatose/L-ribulose 3-epimerase
VKYAVCNELFGTLSLGEAAEIARRHGFHGLEIAPFTVFGDFSAGAIAAGVAEARRVFSGAGVAFAGLHWLMVKPEGLRITSADPVLRRRSWDHLRRLVDAAAELGGGNLILGSPKQRSPEPGQTREQAIAVLSDELAAIAPYCAERKSPILLEALSSDQTNVVNRLAEAAAIVGRVGNPGVAGMFDFHNSSDETEPYDVLVDRHHAMIRHVHLNAMDGGHPKPGDRSYRPVFAVLRKRGYAGWVSLEIFSVPADPAPVLAETIDYLNDIERSLGEGS